MHQEKETLQPCDGNRTYHIKEGMVHVQHQHMVCILIFCLLHKGTKLFYSRGAESFSINKYDISKLLHHSVEIFLPLFLWNIVCTSLPLISPFNKLIEINLYVGIILSHSLHLYIYFCYFWYKDSCDLSLCVTQKQRELETEKDMQAQKST